MQNDFLADEIRKLIGEMEQCEQACRQDFDKPTADVIEAWKDRLVEILKKNEEKH